MPPATTIVQSNAELIARLEETRRELETLKQEFNMYIDYANARIHGLNNQINALRRH